LQSPSPPATSPSPPLTVVADLTAGTLNVNNTKMGQVFSTDAHTFILDSIIINMLECSSLPSTWIAQSSTYSTSGTNLAVSNTGGTYVQFTSMSGQPNITLSPSTSYVFMISNSGSCSWYYSSSSFSGPGTISNSWLCIAGPCWVQLYNFHSRFVSLRLSNKFIVQKIRDAFPVQVNDLSIGNNFLKLVC